MKILVTGGAGYIGSILVRMLLERGYDVTVLDRLFFGDESLKDVKEQIRLVKDDIRWFDPSLLNKVDAVFDLASVSNDPAGELDPKKTLEINHMGRARVATLAKKYGVHRYVLASTCSVYGFQEGIVTEASQVNPLTTYAKASVLAERDILPLAGNKFIVTALRLAPVYGFSYRMRFDLAVNAMVRGLYLNGKVPISGDGRQWRPFVYIRDASKAFISALETEPELVNGQVFNVGSDEQNITIFELARLVCEACDKPFNYERYGSPDNRSYRASFSKIKEALGFRPAYSIKQGAREVWEAIERGLVDPNDPKTITVQWYKRLLSDPYASKTF